MTRSSRRMLRHPVAAAAAVIGAVLAVGAVGRTGGAGGGELSAAPTSAAVAPAPTAPRPSTTAAPSTIATTTTEPESVAWPLRVGSQGPEVVALQDRLRVLGFEPGPSDGRFGALTEQAVWAFEKLVADVPREEATGAVSEDLWQRISEAGPIEPRRTFADGETTRDHTEVYVPEQVVVFFVDDEAVLVSHMSSGSGESWSEVVTIDPGEYRNENGAAPIQLRLLGESITPGGVYTYNRFVDGRRLGALGAMYDPAYFNHGIAVHGADSVPLEPASHGCIRIPRYISGRFHEFVSDGDQVWVWDGDNEPEWLGQVPPPADQVDTAWNGQSS